MSRLGCHDGVHCFTEWAHCECGMVANQPERAESREGMVLVYDGLGQYLGCMGENLWRALLDAEKAA